MATDGCLSSDGRHLELTSKDEEQLRNFMLCVGKDVPVRTKISGYTGKHVSRIQFSDVVLYRFMQEIGLTPKKTLTLGSLSIPDELFFDFLRGHYDGDGSFYSYFDTRWKNSFMFYLVFISASEPHLLWIRDTVKRLTGAKGHITRSACSQVMQLRFAKGESVDIIARMYRESCSVSLTRKRLKILKALRIVSLPLPGQVPGKEMPR